MTTGGVLLIGFILLLIGLFAPVTKMSGINLPGEHHSTMWFINNGDTNLFKYAIDLKDAYSVLGIEWDSAVHLANTAIAGFSFIIIGIATAIFPGILGFIGFNKKRNE